MLDAGRGTKVSLCVAYTSPYDLERATGVGRFLQDMQRSVAGLGIRSIAIRPSADLKAEQRSGALRLHWHNFRNVELATKTVLLLLRNRRLVDIIHCQHTHLQTLLAVFVARVLGKPAVVTIHGTLPLDSRRPRTVITSAIEGLCLAFARNVVAVSAPVATFLNRKGVIIIENGVDPDRFFPSDAARAALRADLGVSRELVFLFAGRWAASKGIDLLIRAVSSGRLSDRPYRLIVAGEHTPEEPRLLEKLIEDAHDTSHITVVGYVQDLPRFLNVADVFVLPSRGYEGMPLAFLEALASGVPVLASDLPVHRALVGAVKAGWVFRTDDEADLRRVLQAVLVAGVPADWPEHARDAVIQRFNLKRMADQYVALYTRLAGK